MKQTISEQLPHAESERTDSAASILATIAGGVLFVTGFALCTGVDENFGQALAALLTLAASAVCFRYAERA